MVAACKILILSVYVSFLGFLLPIEKYVSAIILYNLYFFQVRPFPSETITWILLSYKDRAPPSTLKFLVSIQRRAIQLLNHPVLSAKLPCLGSLRAVWDLCVLLCSFVSRTFKLWNLLPRMPLHPISNPVSTSLQ